MVVAEREVHHRADHHLAVHGDRAVLDAVQAEHGALRRIDDRGGHQRAEHAAIGDGEGAALHVFHGQLAFLGLAAIFGDRQLDFGKAHLIDAAHHRHDEAVGGADGDREIDEIVVDDLVAIDLGIDGRHVLQRQAGGLGEEAHEAQLDAVLLGEQVLVLLARGDHGRHVDVVEGGQQRGFFLRALEALGDGLPQPRHLDPLDPALAPGCRGGRGRRSGSGGRRGRGGGRCRRAIVLRLGGGEHVFLGQAAILAGALDGGRVDPVFEHRPAHRRRHGGGGISGCSGFRGGGRLFLGRRLGGRANGAFLKQCNHRTDFHRIADGDAGLAEDAGDRSRHFHRHLVGFQAGNRLVGGHGFAGLLEPFADSGFGDRFTQRRDFYFNSHVRDPQAFFLRGLARLAAGLLWLDRPSAAETSASCCIWWRLAKPVAGEALASRPA